MKKTLLLLASAALLLVGCAKEKVRPEAGTGEMVTANFTAWMQGMPQTKSVTDGEGTKANRCVMEIYYGGELYLRDVQSVSGMKATFTPTLVSNRTYDVLFWADCGGENLADKYYKTNAVDTNAVALGLQAVEMMATSYAANDDARDAFFAKERVEVLQQVSTEEFTLTRPFAQVNIITTDAAIIKNGNLYPDGVKMVYTAPTKFNLLTGKLSEEKALTVTGTPYEDFDATSTALTLEMDYLFAILDKSALDIAFEASKTGESTVTSHSFTNIPVQRNYRTNIKGALLTTTGNWTAEIDDEWDGAKEEKVVEAGSVAAANEAFANGATNVKITSVGKDTTLYLPQTTKEVTIDFANPSKAITVTYGPAPTKAAGDKPAAVNIATNDITKFVVTGINNIVWLAGNQAALANALANAQSNHTVALSNDITMSGEWTPVTSKNNADGQHYYGTFDGKNHVINNLKITDYTGTYAGFFSHVSGATIKNVTFKNATVTNATSNEGGRGAVIVGWSYACVIDNCHVINSSVTGGQKVAGILGSMSVEGAAGLNSVTNCSVEGLTLSSNVPNDILYQAGGLVGYVQLINANPDGVLIENNSVKNITINDAYSGPNNTAWYCGTFIGSIIRKQQIDGQKIVLNNNTISGTNTELFKTLYSSEYFGWTTNIENYTGAIAPILIDGEEWTPNYPVKIVGGKGYATLDAALTAATAGQTVQILQAGEYTVQTLTTAAAVVEATVEGVVFKHNPTGKNEDWVAKSNNTTVKKITWDLGSSNNYQLFNCACENCTINGRISGHTMVKLTNCILTNTYSTNDYNVTTYGAPCTFEGCTFESQGKFVNVYGDNGAATEVKATNCKFINLKSSVNKAAFNIKGSGPVQHAHVVADSCTTQGLFPDHNTTDGAAIFLDGGLIMFDDPAWEDDVYAVVDGITYYPYFTIDADGNYSVNSATGLKKAIEHWNKLTTTGEYTITVANGTYEVSDMIIRQSLKSRSLTVKAATSKGVTIKPNSDSKTNMIFLIDGCAGQSNPEFVKFDGIKFDMSGLATTVISHPIFCSSSNAKDKTLEKIDGYISSWYAHNVIAVNCELKGYGQQTENISLIYAPSGAGILHVTVENCKVEDAGYCVNGYFTDTKIINTTISNCKACANINTKGISVTGCTINTWHDYCIRTNAGPVVVEGNTFNMTWTGELNDAAIVYLRGTPDNPDFTATISGNSRTKAGAKMYDVYCETAWTVNGGEAKTAGTGINF